MRVIVIDDSPLEGEMISNVLGQNEPTAEYMGQRLDAMSGLEFAKAVRAEVIFLDIRLPGMSGLDIIPLLKEELPDCYIMILTAYSDMKLMQIAIRQGAVDFLTKPFRPEELCAAYRRCIHKYSEAPTAAAAQLDVMVTTVVRGDTELLEKLIADSRKSMAESQDREGSRRMSLNLVTAIIAATAERESQAVGVGYLYQSYAQHIGSDATVEEILDATDTFVREVAALTGKGENTIGAMRISDVKEYIEDRLGENLTLNGVAGYFYLSPSYFSRLFKERTGENFSSYLAGRRISRAKYLLAHTAISVVDVAEAVGYRGNNSFSRLFRAQVGVSPTEYRSKVTAENSAE